MIRFLLLALLSLSLFSASQIETNTKKLEKTQSETEQISKKLEDLASEIIAGEKKLNEINEQVTKTSRLTKELQELVNAQNGELNSFISQNEELIKDKNKLGERLVDIIAKDFSYDYIAPKDLIDSASNVVSIEVLNVLSNVLKDEFYKISKDYARTQEKITFKQRKINEMKENISDYEKKAKELSELKKKQESLISKQKLDEKIYKERLTNLQKQQDELRKTLEKLKIIEAQKKEEATKQAKLEQATKSQSTSTNVKHKDTLEYDGKIAKYDGKKTIPPLVDFTVKQKFGNYIDPIYKLKIFNENVVLRSNTQDANVRVVLDGKVVFANDTAVLDKVVIVEHAQGIHTIYAHLSKFSKLAKVGTVLKKGNIVGKVDRDLTFEVTQKNYHINPLDLITLN